jgi:hypothetical protein
MFLKYFAWDYSYALYYITYQEENMSWQRTSILLVLYHPNKMKEKLLENLK